MGLDDASAGRSVAFPHVSRIAGGAGLLLLLAACGPGAEMTIATATPPTASTTATAATTSLASIMSSAVPTTTVTATATETVVGVGCPVVAVCDAALGVAITPPVGWEQAPAGKYPPGELVFWRTPAPGGANADERLVIAPMGTSAAPAATAVATSMDQLLHGTGMAGASRQPVQYGGANGLLVQGLPGGPSPVTAIVLAHGGDVYKILAPGSTLAADQREALDSLRFIPRVGPFPVASPTAPRGIGAPSEAGG